jgi:hypothetical protein
MIDDHGLFGAAAPVRSTDRMITVRFLGRGIRPLGAL